MNLKMILGGCRFLAQPLFKSFVIFFLSKKRVTSSVNEVTLSLDLTLIRQWLLHQCLIQTIVMEKLNLVRCSLGQLLSRF